VLKLCVASENDAYTPCAGLVWTGWVKLVDAVNDNPRDICGVRCCDFLAVFSDLCDFDHGLEEFRKNGDVPEGQVLGVGIYYEMGIL
jgi:hypothetical protein